MMISRIGWALTALIVTGCASATVGDGGDPATDAAGGNDLGSINGGGDAGADGASADAAGDFDGANDTAAADTAGGGGTCPEAAFLLDVAKGPGAGAGYAKPKLTGICTDTMFTVTSNSMPFYSYVAMTPNALKEANHTWSIPREPKIAATTTEVPLQGIAGFTVAGLPFYGPTEGTQPAAQIYGDPVYNGLMDGCFGHTSPGEYHNHALAQKCLTAAALQTAEPWTLPEWPATDASPLIGWALDGFAIYGPNACLDADCKQVVTVKSGWVKTGDPTTHAWDAYTYTAAPSDPSVLDACNGRVGPDGTYRYHATAGFPYIIGCYKGTPVDAGGGGGGGGGGGPTACSTDSDCTGKCQPGAKGCVCQTVQGGSKGCIPSCTADADCGATPDGKPTTCKQGACRP